MSTLTSTMESSPVKVMRVFADFRRGAPDAGTVFVGGERHKVLVSRTTGGLMAQCECPGGCPARPDAIRAFQIMAETWERPPRRHAEATSAVDARLDSQAEPDRRGREGRPYDGLARAICEADLHPLPIPAWAYDEHGIRRSLRDAEIAADVWYELHRALDRVLAERSAEDAGLSYRPDGHRVSLNGRPNVLQYYRASWEPGLGLSQTAYETDLPVDLGGQDAQPEDAS